VSLAWTTVLIVTLLLPGLAFFAGFWARERYSRELVRSSAVGEVGMAVFVAIVLHLSAWQLLALVGADPSQYFRPLAELEAAPKLLAEEQSLTKLWPPLVYTVCMSVAGFAIGQLVAWCIMFGWLRPLATHQWAYDLLKEKRRGVVTTYVFTNVLESRRAMMYAGHLEEFYLDANGSFSYVVLKNCTRYYMKLEDDSPRTSKRESLFRVSNIGARRWEHLVIDGKYIANILFDPLGHIEQTDKGAARLEAELARQIAHLGRRRPRRRSRRVSRRKRIAA